MPRVSASRKPELLRATAASQLQVVSRAQLAASGYDRDFIRRAIQGHRWQQLGLAILLHAGEPTQGQREWATILSAPGLAALTGRTAARRHGLKRFDAEVIDVLVPARALPVPLPGVRWHRSQRFDEFDIHPALRPPTVQRARAFVDAAQWTPSGRIACALLAAAVQQRRTSVQMLRREVQLAGPIRHRRHILAVLADVEGGADSLAEIDFTKLARQAGLPPPLRQAIRLDASGRRRYLDVDFGTFSVEVDGGVHLQVLTAIDDAKRQIDLTLVGQRILRFPSIVVRTEPEYVVTKLRAAAHVFGLPGR